LDDNDPLASTNPAVRGDELGRLPEHAARAARRVEHAPMERFQHLDQGADY
jgi:hypothetical protein